MVILVLVSVLLIEAFWPVATSIRQYQWLSTYQAKWMSFTVNHDALRPWGIIAVILLLPIILLGLLIIEQHGFSAGLIELIISIVIVYWATGPQSIAELAQSHSEDQDFSSFFNSVFRNYLAVFVWYLLGGVFAVVIYRLCLFFSKDAIEPEEDDQSLVPYWNQLLYWLDWIAARLAIGVSMLVGNFSAAMSVIRPNLLDSEYSNSELIAQGMKAALGQSDEDLDIEQCRDLMDRSIILLLAVAAAVSLFSI